MISLLTHFYITADNILFITATPSAPLFQSDTDPQQSSFHGPHNMPWQLSQHQQQQRGAPLPPYNTSHQNGGCRSPSPPPTYSYELPVNHETSNGEKSGLI